jgi:transposase
MGNVAELEARCALQEQQIAELTAKLNWYEEQHRLSLHRRFGRSSEVSQEQKELFNEAEEESKPSAPEPTIEEVTYKRRKRTGKREEQLKDLPEEVIEYRLPPEDQLCECGGELHEMSTEVRRELKVVPAQVSVVKHIRYVYACRRCEKENIKTTIKTAPMPASVLPGSIASPSAVAHVMAQKYVESMPLYRQEKAFTRFGIELSRQTMANWMIECSERWLTPLYERMHTKLLEQNILQADESELQVLREPGRAATSKSYMWLYRTGRIGPHIVLYDYRSTRARKHVKKFLTGFRGYLQVDGHNGYEKLPGIELAGCWAHARRKFDEALKALPDESKGAKVAAKEGFAYCNKLFELEKQMKHMEPEERYKMRLEKSEPIVDNFYEWLNYQKPRVLPKSSFGAAIGYCLNQWDKLKTFLKDGRLELDNNRAERSIKPFVIGRKNFLFSNTPRGATASARIYSIVETAKENQLNPFTYLKYVFERLPNVDIQDESEIDKLLPYSDDLPQECRVKK